MSTNTKITEFFNYSTKNPTINWREVLNAQHCGYLHRKCIKVRKSEPDITIGTCTVQYANQTTIVCPHRFIEKRKIFIDCLHLLAFHEPGNELHVIPEISIPGGSVDYFLVSMKNGKVADFAGIELQALDTTGSLWPERQMWLAGLQLIPETAGAYPGKSYGINWKMTAKTALVQLHHKIKTFEHFNKHLVIVLQDCLLDYMKKEFAFSQIQPLAKLTDPLHFHAYQLQTDEVGSYRLQLNERMSTNGSGLAAALGLKAEARVEFEQIARTLAAKASDSTLLTI
jgi:hypothetical protein